MNALIRALSGRRPNETRVKKEKINPNDSLQIKINKILDKSETQLGKEQAKEE